VRSKNEVTATPGKRYVISGDMLFLFSTKTPGGIQNLFKNRLESKVGLIILDFNPEYI